LPKPTNKEELEADRRRKIPSVMYLLLDAQLDAGELTIRQAASVYRIRTKYIAKRRVEKEQAQLKREIDFYGVERAMKLMVKCPDCNMLMFPASLTRHVNIWSGDCVKIHRK